MDSGSPRKPKLESLPREMRAVHPATDRMTYGWPPQSGGVATRTPAFPRKPADILDAAG